MKKLLAVSGGLDSMVLLHQFQDAPDVLVAHFNHGTRPSAKTDQEFVRHWAKHYQKPFFTATAHLGEHVSEERARAARYQFLHQVAAEQTAEIYTAHHADDLIETVIINFLRGTGWRGLAPFYNPQVHRPLLSYSKNDLRRYAAEHKIIYREDPTNNEEHYLRNRVRAEVSRLSPFLKTEVFGRAEDQLAIRHKIEQLLAELLQTDNFYQRAWFKNLEDTTALELLRAILAQNNISATRPQLHEFLSAIRTYAPGKQFNLPGGRLVRLHKDHFML